VVSQQAHALTALLDAQYLAKRLFDESLGPDVDSDFLLCNTTLALTIT